MKSTPYAGVVCNWKLVGGSDREQRMPEMSALRPLWPHVIDVLQNAICSRMLVADPI